MRAPRRYEFEAGASVLGPLFGAVLWIVCVIAVVLMSRCAGAAPLLLLCDANGDGVVSEADIAIIYRSRGAVAAPGDVRDVDSNGFVDTVDWQLCQKRIGDTLPPPPVEVAHEMVTIPTLSVQALVLLSVVVGVASAATWRR
jgi:hypothetical protein